MNTIFSNNYNIQYGILELLVIKQNQFEPMRNGKND